MKDLHMHLSLKQIQLAISQYDSIRQSLNQVNAEKRPHSPIKNLISKKPRTIKPFHKIPCNKLSLTATIAILRIKNKKKFTQ